MTMVRPELFVLLGAILFVIGAVGAMVRKNVLVILMCIELMLNGAVLTFLAYAVHRNNETMSPFVFSQTGQAAAFFVMAVAAAEAAVGLAIIVAVFRTAKTTSADEVRLLKW